jgi:hypothetical protein
MDAPPAPPPPPPPREAKRPPPSAGSVPEHVVGKRKPAKPESCDTGAWPFWTMVMSTAAPLGTADDKKAGDSVTDGLPVVVVGSGAPPDAAAAKATRLPAEKHGRTAAATGSVCGRPASAAADTRVVTSESEGPQ